MFLKLPSLEDSDTQTATHTRVCMHVSTSTYTQSLILFLIKSLSDNVAYFFPWHFQIEREIRLVFRGSLIILIYLLPVIFLFLPFYKKSAGRKILLYPLGFKSQKQNYVSFSAVLNPPPAPRTRSTRVRNGDNGFCPCPNALSI